MLDNKRFLDVREGAAADWIESQSPLQPISSILSKYPEQLSNPENSSR